MTFYLGTHEVGWLGRVTVPLFVSAHRLRLCRRLPRARCRWALDSGGFTVLSKHGRWTTSPQDYAVEAAYWSHHIGRPDWIAPQDWMCEPAVREATGLTVEEHQERTCESVATLRQLVRGVDVIPVLQGWVVADYERHARMYEAHGLDLSREPVVGLGTVCRRQSTREGAEIVTTLARHGLRLHGFGFKRTGIARVGHILASADSLAWSFNARRSPPLPGCSHGSCANCLRWALMWREETVSRVGRFPAAAEPLGWQRALWGAA